MNPGPSESEGRASLRFRCADRLLGGEGQQCDLTRTLDGVRQQSLVAGTVPRRLLRYVLSSLRDEPLQPLVRLVVNLVIMLVTEHAALSTRPAVSICLRTGGPARIAAHTTPRGH